MGYGDGPILGFFRGKETFLDFFRAHLGGLINQNKTQ